MLDQVNYLIITYENRLIFVLLNVAYSQKYMQVVLWITC